MFVKNSCHCKHATRSVGNDKGGGEWGLIRAVGSRLRGNDERECVFIPAGHWIPACAGMTFVPAGHLIPAYAGMTACVSGARYAGMTSFLCGGEMYSCCIGVRKVFLIVPLVLAPTYMAVVGCLSCWLLWLGLS